MVDRLRVGKNRKNGGFTIVELMLAMAFVSALLIAIGVLIMGIGRTYERGITYKEMNQAGSDISDDIERTATSSTVSDLKYVNTSDVNRLCFGTYSYVWNEANDNTAAQTTYNGAPAKLLKLVDPESKYCTDVTGTTAIATSSTARELLQTNGNRELSIYRLTITPLSAPDANNLQVARPGELAVQRGLYTIEMTLGTNERDRIDPDTFQCNAPFNEDGSQAADEYCAIDTFRTIVFMGSGATP